MKSIGKFPFQLIQFCFIFLILLSACSKDKDNTSANGELATISTSVISNINHNSAQSGGSITSEGGSSVTARGVCWGTSANPTTSASKSTDGTGIGNFTSNLSGLSPNTKYYVRAYAVNNSGTSYGQQIEFTTNSDLTDGLISYWTFDDNTGTIATDVVGSWNLSFVNNPSWTTPGKINHAIDFGNTSIKYLEKTGINSGNKNTYSLSAWIYLEDNLPNPKYIIGINSGAYASSAGAAEVKLFITPDNKFNTMYYTDDGASTVMERISGTIIALNTWYHLVGIVNNGTIVLYINGVADNTNAVTNSINSNLNFVSGRASVGHARYFNGAYNPDRWFRGKIDEAAIWNRALTAGEVSTLYNNGNGLQYPF